MIDSLQIPLYHITHIDNLASILDTGGLYCDRERFKRGLNPIKIAYLDLKERRMKTPIPMYPQKTLGDFVPFYFANRSPMLFAIHTSSVKDYTGGQESIIYLVSTIGEMRTCRKQAEFLVETFVPMQVFSGIGVMNQTMQKRVLKLVNRKFNPSAVFIEPGWYY